MCKLQAPWTEHFNGTSTTKISSAASLYVIPASCSFVSFVLHVIVIVSFTLPTDWEKIELNSRLHLKYSLIAYPVQLRHRW
jgi:hypothetical protein